MTAEKTPKVAGESKRSMVTPVLLTAVAASFVTWFAVKPSDEMQHDAREYARVRDVGYKHEGCLRELSETSADPSSLADARRRLEHVASRAGDCYRGNW